MGQLTHWPISWHHQPWPVCMVVGLSVVGVRSQVLVEDGWSVMDKHGQNVFLTVLATLVWWESDLSGNGQNDSSWLSAVEDVSWVMSQVMDAR